MSGYGSIVLFVGLGCLLFIYTLLYDIYQGFAYLALDVGADATVMNLNLTLWTWYPLILLICLTIGYLIESQRRTP